MVIEALFSIAQKGDQTKIFVINQPLTGYRNKGSIDLLRCGISIS
jgi:hypothetical protein